MTDEDAGRRFDRDRDDRGRPENQRPRDRTGRPLPYGSSGVDLAEEFTYATVEEALAGGVWLWDQARFFEAHEALEHVWHAAPRDDREFWQGVIQVAVGCVHHQRGNASGAATLLGRAAERLSAYPDVHHGVDVEELVVFCQGAIAAMAQAGGTVEVGYPEFPTMDDGPWFDPDRGPHLLRDAPRWQQGADQLRSEPPDQEDSSG